jgi:hypothetical protein
MILALEAVASAFLFAVLFVPGVIPMLGYGLWKLCGGR